MQIRRPSETSADAMILGGADRDDLRRTPVDQPLVKHAPACAPRRGPTSVG